MLVIGSRGSQLALWQANHVKGLLEGLGQECRIEIIKTTGDQIQNIPLKQIGSKGLFTKEIEEALLDRRIDLAVHSLKDMPTAMPEGLLLTATPPREDARDALIGRTTSELGPGSRVGTGSLRRVAQLSAWRPDLVIQPIRGNVDTRLRKLDEGQHDAIVLASAGLRRLGWADRIAEYLPVEFMCPAVGQGCLAIQTRDEDAEPTRVCAKLDDGDTRACVTAERAVLEKLGGGCQVPVGVHARLTNGELHIRGIVISPDAKRMIALETSGAVQDATRMGTELGEELLGKGGAEILAEVYQQ
jgi:hydroxymethylbilane synthase